MRMDVNVAGPRSAATMGQGKQNAAAGGPTAQTTGSTGPQRAGFVPPGLAKTNGVPPGLVGRDTLPPGIQKKMQPAPTQAEVEPRRENPPVEQEPVELLPAPLSVSTLPPQPVNTFQPVFPTNGLTLQPKQPINTFQPLVFPLEQGPPSILSGVPEAFATGNPLAGPLQLVNNINANAFSTLQSTGLLQGL